MAPPPAVMAVGQAQAGCGRMRSLLVQPPWAAARPLGCCHCPGLARGWRLLAQPLQCLTLG